MSAFDVEYTYQRGFEDAMRRRRETFMSGTNKGGESVEKFTAAQARALMPDRFNEMVEQIHADIREAALAGKTGATITFRSEFNNNGGAYKVKDFLEKEEGYSAILSVMATSFSFCINWRES